MRSASATNRNQSPAYEMSCAANISRKSRLRRRTVQAGVGREGGRAPGILLIEASWVVSSCPLQSGSTRVRRGRHILAERHPHLVLVSPADAQKKRGRPQVGTPPWS